MNETMVTLVGHVATEPALRITTGGARVTSFRLASTERRFDKGVNDWRDAYTTFFTVTTWRTMAENVATSVQKGQPVVVHGRLRDSSYEAKDGQWRTVLEVEAFALGHDLSRGVSTFTKGSSALSINIVRELEEFGDVDLVTGELLDAPADDGVAASYGHAAGSASGSAGGPAGGPAGRPAGRPAGDAVGDPAGDAVGDPAGADVAAANGAERTNADVGSGTRPRSGARAGRASSAA
jgi:single-strand DNA-binding protein